MRSGLKSTQVCVAELERRRVQPTLVDRLGALAPRRVVVDVDLDVGDPQLVEPLLRAPAVATPRAAVHDQIDVLCVVQSSAYLSASRSHPSQR